MKEETHLRFHRKTLGESMELLKKRLKTSKCETLKKLTKV